MKNVDFSALIVIDGLDAMYIKFLWFVKDKLKGFIGWSNSSTLLLYYLHLSLCLAFINTYNTCQLFLMFYILTDFGATPAASTSTGMFGATANTAAPTGGLFSTPAPNNAFGAKTPGFGGTCTLNYNMSAQSSISPLVKKTVFFSAIFSKFQFRLYIQYENVYLPWFYPCANR